MKHFERVTHGTSTGKAGWLFALVAIPAVQAQSSASFEISQAELNFGGRPGNTAGPGTSASFQLSLDALGGGPDGRPMSSASYALQAGFVKANAPPGNASGLLWLDKIDMQWTAAASTVAYNVYRDDLGTLPGLGYGLCFDGGVAGPGAQDTEVPTVGNAFFYLVSAENRGTRSNRVSCGGPLPLRGRFLSWARRTGPPT